MSTLKCTESHGNASVLMMDGPDCCKGTSSRDLNLPLTPAETNGSTEVCAVCAHRGSVATNADATIDASERILTPRPVELDVDAIARIVTQKVSWKVVSAVCITIGIALIVFPAPKSVVGILDAIFTPPAGYTGGWVGLVVKHWQSCILFLIGKITWDATR